ncbi:MAG TPA: lipopolysaccharide heptosyltransferase II [Bryobacteraceae bacterium]|nr:lipopolysaccharide heptosyltransferase II [Bryobacteraceae bacterium]
MTADFSRILIRATNWVGDAVMCLPALRAIRERFPDAHVAILAKPWVADLYRRETFANEIILYDRSRWTIVRRLRTRRFTCAILLQNAFDAALIAWLAGIPHRFGYDRDGRGFLLSRAVAVPKRGEIPRHERFYYLEMLRRAGITGELLESPAIQLAGRTQTERRIIGVSPGAAYGTAKQWLPERFAEAAARLAGERNAEIALFGSGSERELCEKIAGMLAGRPVTNYAGKTTLAEFIDRAGECELFLTNDSGAMHIASALGVPTVAIFGATDDIGTGPTGSHARVVREPVECSPCLLRECPIDHRCMTRVTSERVAEEALKLLEVVRWSVGHTNEDHHAGGVGARDGRPGGEPRLRTL